VGDDLNGALMLDRAVAAAPGARVRAELAALRAEVLLRGEEKVPELAKSVEEARWEARDSDLAAAEMGYDRDEGYRRSRAAG